MFSLSFLRIFMFLFLFSVASEFMCAFMHFSLFYSISTFCVFMCFFSLHSISITLHLFVCILSYSLSLASHFYMPSQYTSLYAFFSSFSICIFSKPSLRTQFTSSSFLYEFCLCLLCVHNLHHSMHLFSLTFSICIFSMPSLRTIYIMK